MGKRGYYDRQEIKLKSRTQEQKKRNGRMLIFYVIAALCVLSSYPIGCKIYKDVVVESDKELNVIPDWALNLIPNGFLETFL